MKKQLALISLSLMALTACNSSTVIPGSTINTRNKTIVYENGETVADTKFDKRVAIYPITFGLVEKMRKPPVLSQNNGALERSKAAYRYHIGKGDVLNIMVWAHTDLNSPVQQSNPQTNQVSRGAWVDEGGYITYPLVGKIQAQGKTIDELQNILTGRLKRYLKNRHQRNRIPLATRIRFRRRRTSRTTADYQRPHDHPRCRQPSGRRGAKCRHPQHQMDAQRR